MDKKEKKLFLLWTPSYYPRFGGLESATREYASFLKERGWKVKIISNKYPVSLPKSEQIDNINIKRYLFLSRPIHYLKNKRLDLFFAYIVFKPITLFRLIFYFKKNKPSIVNVHFPDNQLIELVILSLFFKFNLIVSMHGNEVERMSDLKIKSLRYYLYNKLFFSAEYITGCSQFLLNEFLKTFPQSNSGKCFKVHNGVNESYLNHKIIENKDNQLFTAARFVPKKGLHLLFKVFQKYNDIPLVIAGGNKKELDHLGLKLTKGISIVGRLNSINMIKQLSVSKATLIPSKIEPYGIIIAEALCCGSPVVATNVDGVPEVIDIAKKGLNEQEKNIFNKWVKIVEPDSRTLRIGIEEIINDYNGLKQYNELIPKIRRQFHWSKRLDTFHNRLNEL